MTDNHPTLTADLRTAIVESLRACHRPISVAQWFGVPVDVVREVERTVPGLPERRGHRFRTDAERKEALAMRKAGAPIAAIALALGLPLGTVGTILHNERHGRGPDRSAT